VLLEDELPLLEAGSENEAGHGVVGEFLGHLLGVGYPLAGVLPRSPRGAEPPVGLDWQHVLPLLQQVGGVDLVGGEGHRLLEFLHAGGHPIPQELSAQLALAEEVDLLHQQALLDVHEFLQAEVNEAAVLLPDLIPPPLSQQFECRRHFDLPS